MDPNFTRTTSDKCKTSRNNIVKFEAIGNTESERSEAVGGSQVKEPKSTCACTNISIMQLFHEMKQEYPTVPDQIVSQLVTENCHNRNACLESLKKESLGHPVSAQVYPSLSIHNNKSLFSTMNNSNNQNQNSKNLKIVRHLNEHLKKTSDMSCNNNNNNINNYSNNTNKVNNNNINNSVSDNNMNVKRPTTLSIAKDSQYPYVLRKAPPPPTQSSSSPSNSGASSANSSSMSSPSISSQPLMLNQQQQPQHQLQPQQQQHVLIDSHGIKSTDSLNVQLNVTVSPISSTPDGLPPIPPRPPLRPPRHTTQLHVQPDLPYSSILDNNNNQISQAVNGQRSYTSVNFMLRQPTAIMPTGTTPIDIQAGPSSLTYSSSSFDAKQGYQSHLKITVAGNGESCISAVRTKSPMSPLSSQIDTTINIGDPNNSSPLRIPQITKRSSGLSDFDEVQLISLQKKQKEVIECELRREKEKLNMIKFDVTTLSETKVTRSVIQILREDIQKLRAIIKELTDELDEMGVDVLGDVNAVVSRNQSSPSGSLPRRRPPRPPPPIPQALRSNQSPLPDYNQLYYANSNNNINNNNQQSFGSNLQRSNSQEADGPSWTCSMCTFQNHPLLNQCEECNLPRIQTRAGTIQITSSNFQPLRQTINYQQSASPSLLPSSTSNRTLLTNNNDPNNANSGNTIPATVL